MNMTQMIKVSQRLVKRSALALAALVLTTAAQASITWNLPGNGNWDTSALNWTGDSTTFTDNNLVDVIFDKSTGGTITISANMSPASTTVNAASGTYTFSGGPIDFGSLTKSGAGTLTLSSANTFTGGTTLNSGKLAVRNNYGISTNTLTINGGTFDVLNVTLPSIPIVVNNSCTFFCDSGQNFSSGTGLITLGNNATVTLQLGQSPNLANPINNNGYNLSLINTQDGGTTISGKISGAGGLTLRNDITGNVKTLTVNNSTSDFTGSTILQSSVANNLAIITPNLSNAGVAGSLGKPTGDNAVIQINNDVIWQPGGTTDRGVNLVGAGAGTVQITVMNSPSGNAALGPITATGTGAKTLYLNLPFNNPVTLTVNGAISDATDGSPLTLKFGPGCTDGGNYATLYLNGVNTFSGPINYQLPSGTPNKFNSALNITGAGQLGSGNYTNTISMNTSAWAIFNYGSSANQILSGVISGAGKLIKSGLGSLTLSAANSYTGVTEVNSGKLIVSGSTASGSAVTVNAGGTLGGTGTVSGTVSMPAGGAINLKDGAVGTLNLGSTLTFSGVAATPNALHFDLGNTGSNDKIKVSGVHAAATASGTLVNLNQLPSTTGSGNYTLIEGNVGGNNFTGYTLATTRAGRNLYSALVQNNNNLQVTVGAGTAGAVNPFCYWKGSTASWNTQQWYADAAATSTCTPPGYSSNVRFAATTPGNLSTTLGQDYEINSLTVDSGLAATTIAGSMLTIDATADNSNTAGNGIVVSNILGTTISSKVGLGGSQTWTIGSGAALTVSGIVDDFASGYTLTKAGTGTLTLSGANTYTGPIYVNAGVLLASTSATALGTIDNGTIVMNGASLQLANANINVGAEALTLNGTGVSNTGALRSLGGDKNFAGAITLGSSARINCDNNTWQLTSASGITGVNTDLALGSANGTQYVSGPVSLGSGGLTKDGTGTWNLNSLVNSWRGPTTIAAGTLSVNGGTISSNNTVTINSGAKLTLGNMTFDGLITGAGALTTGGGTWLVLHGANNYTGGTSISPGNDGRCYFDNDNAFGSGTITFFGNTFRGFGSVDATARTIANTISFSSMTSINSRFGKGSSPYGGTGNLTFTGPVIISGNNAYIGVTDNTILTFSGGVTSPGANGLPNTYGMTKDDTGTLLLPTANTFAGDTTLTAGKLVLSNQFALANSALIFNGGTVTFGGNSTAYQFGGLGGSANLTLTNLNNAGVALTLAMNNNAVTYSGILSDNNLGVSLIKTGTGIETLSGANSYGGVTTINGGAIAIGNNLALSTNLVTLAGGGLRAATGSWAITNTINLAQNATIDTGANNLTLAGAVTNSGTLTKAGTGTLALSGANSYTGGSIVSAGALSFLKTAAKPASGAITVAAGATLGLGVTGSDPFSSVDVDSLFLNGLANVGMNPAALVGIDTTAGDWTYATAVPYTTLGLNKLGLNTLTLNGASAYAGPTKVTAGTLRLGVFDAITNNGTVNVAGGIYDLGGFNNVSNGAVTISSGAISNGSLYASSFTFSGGTINANLYGPGALTNNSGTLTLTTTNIFTTGGVVLNGGILMLDFSTLSASNMLNSANVLTLAGGTLSLKGKNNAASLQTFASTTMSANRGSTVTLARQGTGSMTLEMGSITRNTGSVVNFSTAPDASTLLASTSNGNDASGILGPWATVGSGATGATALQYATVSGGQIIRYPDVNATVATATDLSNVLNKDVNYSLAKTAGSTLTGPITANTIRVTSSADTAIDNNGKNITLNGLIGLGANRTIISGTSNLVIGASKELVVHWTVGFSAIACPVVDNPSGDSSVIINVPVNTECNFNGVSTYKGGTTINYPSGGQLNYAANSFGTGNVTVNGPVRFNGNVTLANSLTLNGAILYGNIYNGPIYLASTSYPRMADHNGGPAGSQINGNISGPGGLETGSGNSLPLISGTNTYTGPTTISSGGFYFRGPASLYNGDMSQWTPANIIVNSGCNLSLFIGGTDGFTGAQVGTLLSNLTANVNNNGLKAGSTVRLDPYYAGGTPITVSGDITDSTGVGGGMVSLIVGQKDGGATAQQVNLTGNNTYSGSTSIKRYRTTTLGVTSFNSVNNGNPPLASSSLGRPTTVANGTIRIGDGGDNTTATLLYTGSGETTDRVLQNDSNSSSLTIDQSGSGLLKFTSAMAGSSFNQGFFLKGSTSGAGEFAGAISSAVTKNGTGVWTLSGTNTYTGVTTINGGTLKAGSLSGSFGVNSAVTLANTAGVVLELNGFNVAIGSLAGGGANGDRVLLGAKTLTLGGNNTSTDYKGIISGTGCSLVKVGTGTQILSGTNTYTGNTTISAGILTLGTTNSIGKTATLTIADGVSGGKITLPSGTTTVDNLVLGTTQQWKGTYGSSSSSPTPQYIDNARFAGTGVLNVKIGKIAGTMIAIF